MKINNLLSKKRIVLIILSILLLGTVVWAATYYQVNVGQTAYITEWSTCKKVYNGGSYAIFVPTNTGGEWSAFYGNVPSGVSASSVTCCGGGGSDPYNDCNGLDCDGGATKYYWGTTTDMNGRPRTCYYRTDVAAGSHNCDNYEQCRTAAQDCPLSGQGAIAATYPCKYVISGCSSTTAPTWANVPNEEVNEDCWGAEGVYCWEGECVV